MNTLAFDADRSIALLALFLAAYGAYEAFRAIRARAVARAVFWCAGAFVAGLVALFFATFTIRLL